jgi:hypothetical protein
VWYVVVCLFVCLFVFFFFEKFTIRCDNDQCHFCAQCDKDCHAGKINAAHKRIPTEEFEKVLIVSIVRLVNSEDAKGHHSEMLAAPEIRTRVLL